MPVSLKHMRNLLLTGLRRTPEEALGAQIRANTDMGKKIAKEIARYNSLSEQGKRDYDALTEGMMPRLAKRSIGHPTGGRN